VLDLASQSKAATGPLGGVVGEANSTEEQSVSALEHVVDGLGDGGRGRQTRKRNTISYVVEDPKSSACATLGTASSVIDCMREGTPGLGQRPKGLNFAGPTRRAQTDIGVFPST
jgi:hypothetical protein